MYPFLFQQRRNWQQHVLDNAYQCQPLTDIKQRYWVEALPQPFGILFSREEELKLGEATAVLWDMCREFLDWFFSADGLEDRLKKLAIPPAFWEAIQVSWDRVDWEEDLSLYTRFDLAVTEQGQMSLLEINGETPLLGAETVYQWLWLEDMRRSAGAGRSLPEDADQCNRFWDEVAGQFRLLSRQYDLKQFGLSLLIDENLSEDAEMAGQLVEIINQELGGDRFFTQLVGLRQQLGIDEDGFFVDQFNNRIFRLWKIVDWLDLQLAAQSFNADKALAARLLSGDVKILEPLWKQILSNKGAMVWMWELFQNHPVYAQFLLPTFFRDTISIASTELLVQMHVKKPLVGLEGVGVSIETGDGIAGAVHSRDARGYDREGFIIQQYQQLPEYFGYHFVVGSWIVGDTSAGLILRGDTNPITGRHCLIAPHLVSDSLLIT
ncbi:MAG: glutathionylspermidine synthase family protein [Leptolyngbyaceae cyanobacterium CSU_1_4]|nr:glutathionylspermidine synthase family protein [Leptolyngbyaceae cyanobacterium CSU_1_4]